MTKYNMFEKDLEIYDVWESPNGNLFIKVTEDYSLAIGLKGHHDPFEHDLKNSQYVKKSDITPVKKVGNLRFNGDKKELSFSMNGIREQLTDSFNHLTRLIENGYDEVEKEFDKYNLDAEDIQKEIKFMRSLIVLLNNISISEYENFDFMSDKYVNDIDIVFE